MEHKANPLEWPVGYPRTRAGQRTRSPFKQRSFGRARDELVDELHRMGSMRIVISTNVPLRRDGLPYADHRARVDDPGVAAFFVRRIRDLQTRRWDDRAFAIACDQYATVWENMRALFLTIDSLRRIERHGSGQLMEQAFAGFKQLTAPPDHQPPWREVLGGAASVNAAERRYRELVRESHPDLGESGGDERLRRLNLAIEEARAELG